jgi:hypothetical protein
LLLVLLTYRHDALVIPHQAACSELYRPMCLGIL